MKPNGANLPVPISSSFEIVEKLDDEAIIEMMTGQAIQEYVYSFNQGGRNVEGLTLAGINEAANRRGGIQVEDIKFEETETSWVAIIKAVDTLTGSSRYGAFEQPKTMGGKEDPYAFTKAIHKAQRNAIKQLLPVTVIREVLNFYLKGPKGKPMPAPVPPKSQPKAVPSATPKHENGNGAIGKDRAEKLVAGCVNRIGEREYAVVFDSMKFNCSIDALTQAQAEALKKAVLVVDKTLKSPLGEKQRIEYLNECLSLVEQGEFGDIFQSVCGDKKEPAEATLAEWKEVHARCIQQALRVEEPTIEEVSEPVPSDPDYQGPEQTESTF